MYCIEISQNNHNLFLEYLSENINNNKILKFVPVLDGNKIKYIIGFNEFIWIDNDNNTFNISYLQENKPKSCQDGIYYYVRLLVYHEKLDILQKFINKAFNYNSNIVNDNNIKIKNNFYDSWSLSKTIAAQSLENIYIPKDIKNDIINKIDKFIYNKEKYIKFGKSYKKTFLFTGVPGSGKTSLSKSLALKYNRPLYIINFSKYLSDQNFIHLINDVKENSILLFEDVDSFFIDRKAEDINLSFSCFINLLDGSTTNGSGNIIILTANNPENFDPALLRPGRIDHIIQFDYPKKTEIKEAFMELVDSKYNNEEYFDKFWNLIKNKEINMSGIVNYLFSYPIDFIENINELLEQIDNIKNITEYKINKVYS